MGKRVVEMGLVHCGVPWLSRLLHRRHPVILAFHNVLPDGVRPQGERSLHLHRRDFAHHLDRLVRTHRIVPLSRLWDDDADSGWPSPKAAITFDDAYEGALSVGIEEVVRRGLSATVFVAPGLLGSTPFWWDLLAEAWGGELPPEIRRHALEGLGGRQERVLSWARARGTRLREPGRWTRSGTEEQVLAAARRPGITLGSHTWGHANAALLEGAELGDELERSRRWLEERTGSFLPWLSFPYGLSSEAARRAAAASYDAAVGTDGGLASVGRPTSDGCYRIPRLNIPAGLSGEGFRLRVSGLST